MTWTKGTSGNPKGRTPGTGEVAKLRVAIREHQAAIVEKLAEQAKGGDVAAARLLLERVCAPVKAAEEAEAISLAGETLTDQGRSVFAALAAGEISPTHAATLVGALGSMAKLAEADELERRIAALEEKTGGQI
jgi:hypothetical protein